MDDSKVVGRNKTFIIKAEQLRPDRLIKLIVIEDTKMIPDGGTQQRHSVMADGAPDPLLGWWAPLIDPTAHLVYCDKSE